MYVYVRELVSVRMCAHGSMCKYGCVQVWVCVSIGCVQVWVCASVGVCKCGCVQVLCNSSILTAFMEIRH